MLSIMIKIVFISVKPALKLVVVKEFRLKKISPFLYLITRGIKSQNNFEQ